MPRQLKTLAALASLPLSCLLIIGAPAASAARTAPVAPHGGSARGIATRVNAALRGSTARHVDYRIVIDGTGMISHDASRASAPASNQKLFTVITLLDLLGPEFRYATTISGTSRLAANGTMNGSLVLRGSGDPTLTISDLRAMAKRLHAQGLRHVSGHLIIDDSRYSHTTRVSGWKRKFVPVESGTIDAFSVDDNQWRGGSAFDRDPTLDNARLWRAALRKAHISVAGSIRVEVAPGGLQRLLTHRSPDLAAITDDTLTNSINFNAEMMLREAGAQRSGYGSPATGVAAVKAVAGQLGLPIGTLHDGSGLSYTDREAPATVVRWLTTLKTSMPFYDTVYFALPLSCDTGTLVGRMCGSTLRGRVRAKTGTLNHHTALSGYTTTRSGRAVTFSFLLSSFKDKNLSRVMDHVNAAVAAVVRNG